MRRPSLLIAARRGAWLGLKWTTLIIGPVAALYLLIGLCLIAYAILKTGGVHVISWEMVKVSLFGPFGVFFVCALWGCVLGLLLAIVAHLLGRH
jgi:hypothetical protein